MSRSISIWYTVKDRDYDIDIGNNDLLGTQSYSKKFWTWLKDQKFGLQELTLLGHIDPIIFKGWEELELLEKEISIMEKNRIEICAHIDISGRWIDNLRYCLEKLLKHAPMDATPCYMIG